MSLDVFFYSRSCLFLFVLTDLIYKDIELFWYRYFVYKMTTNFTEQIAIKKKHYMVLFPVYIYVNRTSILVFSSQFCKF